MKISTKIFIFLFFLLNLISEVRADMVYLKNGFQMEGIIKRETDEYVELAINLGRVKFYRGQVERVRYYTPEENQMLEQYWKDERIRKEAELKKREEQKETTAKEMEVSRQGNHLFVNALLDGRVKVKLLIDTGSSFVLLSSAIAKKLNKSIEGIEPDVEISLADGRVIPGKLFTLETIRIGEIKVKDVQAVVIYQDKPFQEFEGLLGMSFLKLFKFEINLEKNKITMQKL